MAIKHVSSQPLAASAANPYKGPSSFEIEDEHLFFGRHCEATTLSRRILASRMVVLHAPSGAGKTSLLNARIVPMLERQRWVVVRIRPERNPLLAVRSGVVDSLLPELATERYALRRALRLLHAPPTSSLGDLLRIYQALQPAARDRDVMRPVLLKDADPAAARATGTQIRRPHVCRVLRGTLEPRVLFRFWMWIQKWGSPDRPVEPITPDMPVERLLEVLSAAPSLRTERADAFDKSYRRLRLLLNPSAWSLRDYFQQLTTFLDQTEFGCGFVLLLDQFEEIFTRFRDDRESAASAEPSPDWRLRPQFFAELERLYRDEAGDGESAAEAVTAHLPIRYVISLRDEWLSRLGPIWRFAPEAVKSVVRIDFLAPDQARDAIQAPLLLRGLSYEPSAVGRLVEGITDEAEQLVDPGRLQIICDKLWDERDRRVVARLDDPPVAITRGTLERLGGTASILEHFFSEYLRTLAAQFSAADEALDGITADERESFVRLEVLDLVDPLVTPSGTRNKVSRDRLLHAPFRRSEFRRRFLECLEAERIIRREPTGDGDFYEVTHEFLLLPIREEIYREPQFDGLARALRALLSRLEEDPFARLPKELFFMLDRHQNLFRWDAESAEVLLRNAVIHDGDGHTVKGWADRFDALVAAERARQATSAAAVSCRATGLPATPARFLTRVASARSVACGLPDDEARGRLLRTLIRRPGQLTEDQLEPFTVQR